MITSLAEATEIHSHVICHCWLKPTQNGDILYCTRLSMSSLALIGQSSPWLRLSGAGWWRQTPSCSRSILLSRTCPWTTHWPQLTYHDANVTPMIVSTRHSQHRLTLIHLYYYYYYSYYYYYNDDCYVFKQNTSTHLASLVHKESSFVFLFSRRLLLRLVSCHKAHVTWSFFFFNLDDDYYYYLDGSYERKTRAIYLNMERDKLFNVLKRSQDVSF